MSVSNGKNNFVQFEILPSEGMGNVKLGDSLYLTLMKLKAIRLDNDIRFIHSPKSPIIILQLIKYNINLTFGSVLQKLLVIEINLKEKHGANYDFNFKNDPILHFEFKTLYNKIFGPTYPGVLKDSDFYLSYPGIAFKFDNVSEVVNLTNGDDDVIQLLSNSKCEINCSSITIFKGTSWLDASDIIKEQLKNPFVDGRFTMFESELLSDAYSDSSSDDLLKSTSNNPEVLIKYAEISIATSLVNLLFSKHPDSLSNFLIQLNHTTMQDVIKILGPPEDSVIKTKESKIPNSRKKKLLEYYKIHNYFKHGLDIVYKLDVTDGGSNVVSKIVIHNNMVNSLEFMKYERLNFIMTGFDDKIHGFLQSSLSLADDGSLSFKELNGTLLTADEYHLLHNAQPFDIIKEKLNIDSEANKPIFLNRKEYDLNNPSTNQTSNNVFEMINYEDDFDDSESDGKQSSVSTLAGSANFNDEDEEVKNWGLSKMYGYGNKCIFEILIDGDCLSSIILF